MVTVILNMDVSQASGGERKIRKVLRRMDGVEEVEVYPDSDRVVVTGNVEATELQVRLERKFRVPVYLVSDNDPNLELSSDEDDDDDDDDDHGTSAVMSSLTLDDTPWTNQSAGGWYAVATPEPAWQDQPVPDPSAYFQQFGVNAPPVRQPAWEDQPVPDPSSYFFQYGTTRPVAQPAWEDQPVADPSPYFFQQYSSTPPVPPENESEYLPLIEARDRGNNKDCSIM